MIRLLLTGDKNWTNKEIINDILSNYDPEKYTIFVREGRGSRLIQTLARRKQFRTISIKALWDKYGNKAGLIRNDHIIKQQRPEKVYCFHNWIEYGNGIDHLIKLCKIEEVPVNIYSEHKKEPLILNKIDEEKPEISNGMLEFIYEECGNEIGDELLKLPEVGTDVYKNKLLDSKLNMKNNYDRIKEDEKSTKIINPISQEVLTKKAEMEIKYMWKQATNMTSSQRQKKQKKN